MDEALVEAVRRRARRVCEYCLLPEQLQLGPFEIDHVIARKHGGPTALGNLAFSCFRWNEHS